MLNKYIMFSNSKIIASIIVISILTKRNRVYDFFSILEQPYNTGHTTDAVWTKVLGDNTSTPMPQCSDGDTVLWKAPSFGGDVKPRS